MNSPHNAFPPSNKSRSMKTAILWILVIQSTLASPFSALAATVPNGSQRPYAEQIKEGLRLRASLTAELNRFGQRVMSDDLEAKGSLSGAGVGFLFFFLQQIEGKFQAEYKDFYGKYSNGTLYKILIRGEGLDKILKSLNAARDFLGSRPELLATPRFRPGTQLFREIFSQTTLSSEEYIQIIESKVLRLRQLVAHLELKQFEMTDRETGVYQELKAWITHSGVSKVSIDVISAFEVVGEVGMDGDSCKPAKIYYAGNNNLLKLCKFHITTMLKRLAGHTHCVPNITLKIGNRWLITKRDMEKLSEHEAYETKPHERSFVIGKNPAIQPFSE